MRAALSFTDDMTMFLTSSCKNCTITTSIAQKYYNSTTALAVYPQGTMLIPVVSYNYGGGLGVKRYTDFVRFLGHTDAKLEFFGIEGISQE